MADATRIEKWVNQINIEIDYYAYFIKAWIPFNAWYRQNYPDHDGDRAIVNRIKRTGNIFKQSIINLLQNNSQEAEEFKLVLSNLHYALENTSIHYETKYKTDYIIRLSEIQTEVNAKSKIDNEIKRGVKYFLQRHRDSGEIKIIVKKSNDIIIEQSNYCVDSLKSNTDFISLSEAQKSYVLAYYDEINPWKPSSILAENHGDFIECGNFKFINDYEEIAKIIIECLYLLRNTLIHGELHPTTETMEVYKNAYLILSTLVYKLV
ncbi:MAG: hypothetical protein FH761_19365 [Firmicutes bacterium]|nr:hypothetical protein [Bacillota bacterium]